MRGAEKLADERAGLVVPHAEAFREVQRFSHPELALRIDGQAVHVQQAVLHPRPDGRSAALPPDRQRRLAVGREHLDLHARLAFAHVDSAVSIDRKAPGVSQSGHHRLDGISCRIDGRNGVGSGKHVEERVAHGDDATGRGHGNGLENLPVLGVEYGDEIALHHGDFLREHGLDLPAHRGLQLQRSHFGPSIDERLVGEHAVDGPGHGVADVWRVVVGRSERLVFWIIASQPGCGPLADVRVGLLPDRLADAVARGGELGEEGPPVGHVTPAEIVGAEGEVELAVAGRHRLGLVGHAGLVLPKIFHEEISEPAIVCTVPVLIGAGGRVEAEEHLRAAGVVADVDEVALNGQQVGAAEASVFVLPADVAVEVAGEQAPARLGGSPAKVNGIALGRTRPRHAEVASPVGRRSAVPGCVAAVARPASQAEADAFVPDGLPSVVVGGQHRAGRAPDRRGQTVPRHRVLAHGHRLGIEEIPHHDAVGVAEEHRYVAVLGHGELDGNKALRPLAEGRPVNHRHALLQGYRQPAAVGQVQHPGLHLPGALEGRRAELIELARSPIGAFRHHSGHETVPGIQTPAKREDEHHSHLAAGPRGDTFAGNHLEGNPDLLRIAFAARVVEKHLLRAHLLRVTRALERRLECERDRFLPVQVARAGQVGLKLLRCAGRREHVHPQRAAGGSVVMTEAACDARKHVEIILVVHRMKPRAVLVTLLLHVFAGKVATGEVPVVESAVDDDLARRRQHGNAVVLGLRAGIYGHRQQATDGKEVESGLHGRSLSGKRVWSVLGSWFLVLGSWFLARRALTIAD